MKGKSFVLSAIILALGGFFAKAIGAFYKIPLTNILGSSGMGLYYLIFPVYSLILTICGSGISVALACEVAKCRRLRHRYNEQKLLRVSLVLGFCMSSVLAIVVIIICKPLAELQGNINAGVGYIAIAPAIIISTLISTLRGYFQGVENMVPTTVSLIVEQIVKLSVGLILAHKLCNYGIQYAVLGAIIGVTISEVVALIIISINFISFRGQLYYNYRNKWYRKKRKNIPKTYVKAQRDISNAINTSLVNKRFVTNSLRIRLTTKEAIFKLIKLILPVTLSSIILPVATMLDSFMIINILVESGYSSVVSTSLYGLWGGVVQSLISLPTIIIAGISTSIVPSLSGIVGGDNVGKVGLRVKFFIKITLILAIFMVAILFVFAEDILYFLYGDGLSKDVVDELFYATKMLKISSISVVYYAFLQTFTAILQTMNKSQIPFWAMLVGLGFKLFLNIILIRIPCINIFGAIIANIGFISIAVLILAWCIGRLIDLEIELWNGLIFPIVIGGFVALLMLCIHSGLSQIINYFVSMILSAVIGLIIYLICVYFSRVFGVREKREFLLKRGGFGKKKSKKSVKVSQN